MVEVGGNDRFNVVEAAGIDSVKVVKLLSAGFTVMMLGTGGVDAFAGAVVDGCGGGGAGAVAPPAVNTAMALSMAALACEMLCCAVA